MNWGEQGDKPKEYSWIKLLSKCPTSPVNIFTYTIYVCDFLFKFYRCKV